MIWKDIPELNGYEASSGGDIRNKKTGTILRPFIDPQQEYGRITIQRGNRKRKFMAHILIARAFLGPKPDGYEIDHINTNRTDNRPCNLRYVTPRENRNNPNTQRNIKIGTVKMMMTKGYISKAEGQKRILELARELQGEQV